MASKDICGDDHDNHPGGYSNYRRNIAVWQEPDEDYRCFKSLDCSHRESRSHYPLFKLLMMGKARGPALDHGTSCALYEPQSEVQEQDPSYELYIPWLEACNETTK